jgi:hypothetical protein
MRNVNRKKKMITVNLRQWGNIDYFFSTGYLALDHSFQPPLRAFALKPLAISSFATRALVASFGHAQ